MKQQNNVNLSDILNTRSKKEQVERVQTLIKLVQEPVIDIVVRYDPRINSLTSSVIGINELPAQDAIKILESAIEQIRNAEIEELKKRVEDNSPATNDGGVEEMEH